VNDTARISIVIPVQDARTRVAPVLCSILNSDLSEFEVIIVNGGSDDCGRSPSSGVPDLRVLTMQVRPGQTVARLRNLGAARAGSPYVAFLDPDDIVDRRWLSRAVDALDCCPGAGFAFSDCAHTDSSGIATHRSVPSGVGRLLTSNPFENHWQLIEREHFARGLLEANFINVSGLVLRGQLLTEIGPFNERLADWAAYDLWFRLAHCRDALYLNEIAVWHREPGSSAPRGEIDGCLFALQRERDRWNDRKARHQIERRIAEHLATVACEERGHGHRLRSIAMLACAYALCREIRWLREMLRSLLWTPRAGAREQVAESVMRPMNSDSTYPSQLSGAAASAAHQTASL
jgi:glycosyltransferase involved in cell wall biosynthesis